VNPKPTAKAHHKNRRKTEEVIAVWALCEQISPDFTCRLYENSAACFYRSGNITGRHHIMIRSAATLPTLFVTSLTVNKAERRCDDFIDLSLNSINFGIVCTGHSSDGVVEFKLVMRPRVVVSFVCEAEASRFSPRRAFSSRPLRLDCASDLGRQPI
jgi:hypothetical protein